MGLKQVKVPIGMISSYFYPITAEPLNAHPTYGSKLDMGAAVTGTVAVTTDVVDIPGDDEILVHMETYVSHQADVETTLDDLQLNAELYGHTVNDGEVIAGKDDVPNLGAYGFIEPLLKKDKTRVYRATFFFKMNPLQSAERQEATTKQTNLTYKNNRISLFGQADNAGDWRAQKEFATLAEAETYLDVCAGLSGSHPVELTLIGSGTASQPGTVYIATGSSYVVDFSAAPTKIYDKTGSGVTDVTAQLSTKRLTLSNVTAAHSLTAIFT